MGRKLLHLLALQENGKGNNTFVCGGRKSEGKTNICVVLGRKKEGKNGMKCLRRKNRSLNMSEKNPN